MKRTVLALSAALTASLSSAAAGDDLRDVMILDRGGAQHVWIALDAMPSQMEARAEPGRLTLQLDAFAPDAARRIIPAGSGPLSAIELIPGEAGASLVIDGDFQTADATMRQGGVWIALDGALDGALARTAGEVASGEDQDVIAAPAVTAEPVADAAMMADGADRSDRASADQAGEPDAPGRAGFSDEPSGTSAPAQGGAPAPVQAQGDAQDRPADGVEDEGAAPPPDGPAPDGALAPEAGVAADPDASAPCDTTAAAVQQSPWDLDGLTRHADCLVQIGARDNAAGLYERVLAFDPTHFRAAIGLARIREAQGRRDEAAALYQRAADAALTDGEALAARAAAGRNRDEDE